MPASRRMWSVLPPRWKARSTPRRGASPTRTPMRASTGNSTRSGASSARSPARSGFRAWLPACRRSATRSRSFRTACPAGAAWRNCVPSWRRSAAACAPARTPASASASTRWAPSSTPCAAARPRASTVGPTRSCTRLDALAEKVDRVHINPVGDLIGRLEDLGATLRRPVVPGEDIASIHAMLHDLAIKLDRIGTGDGPRDEGLDALEQQVLALAQRIDTRDADPAIAGLQRSMSDLLDQVSALRAEAPIEAAAERAARHAVAESMGAADAVRSGCCAPASPICARIRSLPSSGCNRPSRGSTPPWSASSGASAPARARPPRRPAPCARPWPSARTR